MKVPPGRRLTLAFSNRLFDNLGLLNQRLQGPVAEKPVRAENSNRPSEPIRHLTIQQIKDMYDVSHLGVKYGKIEVCFTGHVQGVGFRYTTHRIALRWRVTGYVENRSDGSVFLVAEGAREELESFVDEVTAELEANIQKAENIVTPPAVSGLNFGFVR